MNQNGLQSPRVEYRDEYIEAVNDGDADRVKSLLTANDELLDYIDEPWFSFDAPAIVFASSMGNLPLIDVLIDAGADIDRKSSWWAGGTSALQQVSGAMLGYNRELAEYLIERGATIEAHAAAGLEMPETLEALIKQDPDVIHAPGCDGMSPLHFAATPKIAEILLKHGANINLRDRDHWGTAAQWTIRRRPEVSRYLLEQGAEGDVVLYCAIGDVERAKVEFQKNPELLNLRIDSKSSTGYVIPSAKSTSSDNNGEGVPGGHVYAYQVARPSTPLLEIALRRKFTEITDLLIESGYKINLQEWYTIVGQGPKSLDELVKGLIAKGVNINSLQEHRRGMWTPLHWLAQRGLTDGIACLLANGADPNVTDDKGKTPLHFISIKGIGKNQVQLLVENGANLNARDDAGQTPLDYANRAMRKSVATVLAELAVNNKVN